MSDRCPICGGNSTCPAGDKIFLLEDDAPFQLENGRDVPAGYIKTHSKKHYSLIVNDGATIVGSNQRLRILAHNPHLEAVWVGMCRYGFQKKGIKHENDQHKNT